MKRMASNLQIPPPIKLTTTIKLKYSFRFECSLLAIQSKDYKMVFSGLII
jgi:hypothetical protein